MNNRQLKKKLKKTVVTTVTTVTTVTADDPLTEREIMKQSLEKEGIDLDWLELSMEISAIPEYLEPILHHAKYKEREALQKLREAS